MLFAAVAVGILAVPGSAAAESDCSYATGTVQTVGPVTVYADADGAAGTTGTAAVAAGACADGIGVAGFDGGFAEVGASPEDPGADGSSPVNLPDGYAVVDGSDANSDPAGQSDGYVGISNYETGGTRTSEASCAASGPDNGSAGSSNSGGCLGIDEVISVYVPADLPTPVCGNTSGNSFDGSGSQGTGSRDGCSLP
jgi:hypothetical protein